MSSQQNSQGQDWQRGTNQYGNRYDYRGEGAAQGGKIHLRTIEIDLHTFRQ